MIMDFNLNKKSNQVEVSVKINGKGPFAFNLDIGASRTSIKEEMIDSLGIKILQDLTEDAKTAGGIIKVRLADLETFSVGSETVENLRVRFHHFRTMGKGMGKNEICGVIGHDFLKNYILSVNYPKEKLSLVKTGENTDLNSAGKLVNFDYLNKDSHLVTVETFINGKGPVHFILDTGAGASMLNHEFAVNSQIELESSGTIAMSPAGPIETKIAKIDEFKTFKTFTGLKMLVIPINHLLEDHEKILGGIIGYDLLKDFELIIDYPGKQLGLHET